MPRKASSMDDLPVDWRDIMQELRSQGRPMAAVLRKYNITRGIHRSLMKRESEYAEEVEMGDLAYEEFWHEWVKTRAEQGANANIGAGVFLLKAQCGYRDYEVKKDDDDEKGKIPVSEKDIEEKYRHTHEAH